MSFRMNHSTESALSCNTCYNVCPMQDEAISLKDNLYPVILDGCVGCGICVERCPTRPKRAVNVIPTGMGRVDEAGFYFRKAKSIFDISHSKESDSPRKPLRGQGLIEQKFRIDSSGKQPKFEFPISKAQVYRRLGLMYLPYRRAAQLSVFVLMFVVPILNVDEVYGITGTFYAINFGGLGIADPAVIFQAIFAAGELTIPLLTAAIFPLFVAILLGRFLVWVVMPLPIYRRMH